MSGKWTENDRSQWRARDDEPFYYGRDREERSFERARPDPYAARRSGPDRDRVFGERETGAGYARPTGGPAYGGGYRGPAGRVGGQAYGPQDYTAGYYGDDDRERIHREDYGQADVGFGELPRGYDGAYSPTRARYHAEGYGEPGYGGYDDGRRGESRGARFEAAGRGAGEFLHRAGEKMAAWFGAGSESRIYDPEFQGAPRGARGLGPQGYKRSDERISDDAHERLTEDAWLDATNITLTVSAGEITLSGTVETREAKHRAERIVEEIGGVSHVQNNLRMDKGSFLRSAGSGYGDSVLDAQMRAEDPVANGTGGAGAGQSTAGRKT